MILANRRSLLRQPRRDAWVEVNLSALEHNGRQLFDLLRNTPWRLMAVLKADAYGHGVGMTLPTLEASGVSSVAVASVDEALEVRETGTRLPILVLGPTPDWAVETAIRQTITLTVFAEHHAQALVACAQRLNRTVAVHVKVDTGMHRVGVPWRQAFDFIRYCQQSPWLQVEGVFTHLACGEQLTPTLAQAERWRQVVDALAGAQVLPSCRHWLNTSGLHTLQGEREDSALPDWLFNPVYGNTVRVGLALWGYGQSSLRPVMGLKARITHLQALEGGEGVSYGHAYVTTHPTQLATLPLGYADGLPRLLSGRLKGRCHGLPVSQAGVITMDQLMMDVTGVAGVQVGDVVTLVSEQPGHTLADLAQAIGAIPYELMCSLRVRLPKVYSRD